VRGLPPGPWDDCLTWIDFQDGLITALDHGNGFFAVGLYTGQISLYDSPSLQVLWQCEHPERVNILEFSSDDLLLGSCGAKHLVIWDTESGTVLHSFPSLSPPLAITFLGLEEVLVALKSCQLTKWYVKS
jgi:WD40 repeat protein